MKLGKNMVQEMVASYIKIYLSLFYRGFTPVTPKQVHKKTNMNQKQGTHKDNLGTYSLGTKTRHQN